jgi:hypothetical protein
MAQTLQQWHDKVIKWVPSWYFENRYGNAVADGCFWAMAAVLQQVEQDMDDQQNATFIMQAVAPILDLHGDERSIYRTSGEADDVYDVQIQTGLFLSVCENELLTLINAVLNNGPAFMILNEQYGFCDDADVSETPGIPYFDDQYSIYLALSKWYNWWTVIIPVQTGGVVSSIAAALITAIENNKASGTTYDVVFEISDDMLDQSGGYVLDQAGGKIQSEN